MVETITKKPAKKVLTPEEKAELQTQAEKMTAELVEKSQKALTAFSTFTQEQVDKIVAAMALAGSENSLVLAHAAHDETGRGVVEDKDTKNRFASESVYNAIKFDKTVGVISEDKIQGKVELAAPLGVLAGIDEASASARMNQYERGKHTPDFEMMCKLAKILKVPENYFYTTDDVMAEMILIYNKLNYDDKKEIVEFMERLLEK